ncbi:MAG: PKD domain-containing protein, partial [Chitinophagales bacterium]
LFASANAQDCHPGFHATVTGYDAAFTNTSAATGDITSYYWEFGDGSTSYEQSPSHIYTSDGNYYVCLTITAHNPFCTETYCDSVVIHHPSDSCHASFTFHTTGLSVDFTDASTSTEIISSWFWDFGDGQTSDQQNPSHTYNHDGTYHVCVTISDVHEICTSTFCHEVTLDPPSDTCQASFTFHATDLTVDFIDASTSTETISSWFWDFGDGHTSDQQNPSHTYYHEGTYHVCVTISDIHEICTTTFCHEVTVHHSNPCEAAFTFAADATGNGIQFSNASSGTTDHTTYYWTFGDGATSQDENPFHKYNHCGHHTACLYITDSTTGCSSHSCLTIYHHPQDHPCKRQHHNPHFLEPQKNPIVGLDENINLLTYPNPVADLLMIEYNLTQAANVKIEIYDFAGNRLIALSKSNEAAGSHIKTVQEIILSSGLYLLKVTVNEKTYVTRIAVQK